MSALPKTSTDNVIDFNEFSRKIIRGGLSENEVRLNKDGSIDKRHCNKVAGVSSEVCPYNESEIESLIKLFNERIENASDNNKKQIASRNKLLFLIGINLSLRISDLIILRWNFFFDDNMEFKESQKIQPKKTRKKGKFVPLFINEAIKKAIMEYIERYPIEDMNDYVFKSRKGDSAITERSVWKIIVDASAECGIEKNVGTHSLRKTFGYHVFHNAEDKEKALVMLNVIFNHSSIATTKKYIGVMDEEVESVFNELNLGLDLF